MNPVAIVFWAFMIGVPALVVGSLLLTRRRQRGWPRAEARVVEPQGRGAAQLSAMRRSLTVSFAAPAGPVIADLGHPRPPPDRAPHVGDAVLVAYDPADPRRAALAAEGARPLGALLVWTAIFLAFVAACAAWNLT